MHEYASKCLIAGGAPRKKVDVERLAVLVNAAMGWVPGTAEALPQRELNWYSELSGLKAQTEDAVEYMREFTCRRT